MESLVTICVKSLGRERDELPTRGSYPDPLASYESGQPSWTLFWDQIVFAQARRDRKSPEMEAVKLGGSALVGLLELHHHRSSHFWADHAIAKVSAHLCCACTCRKVERANDMLQGTKS